MQRGHSSLLVSSGSRGGNVRAARQTFKPTAVARVPFSYADRRRLAAFTAKKPHHGPRRNCLFTLVGHSRRCE
jgi:hypothetical protein